MTCPRCWSGKIIKNGSIHNGKQKYMCRECGRQFVENPANKPVSGEKKELINRLLTGKISLAGPVLPGPYAFPKHGFRVM